MFDVAGFSRGFLSLGDSGIFSGVAGFCGDCIIYF
jgi:hypothetical protein